MAKKTLTTILDDAVMTDAGLTLNGVVLQQIIDKCEGCERVVNHETGSNYCTSYSQPASKWIQGVCNFATHIRAEKDAGGKIKINPLKASKRAARGR
ncbi:MAG: PxxKW family cysteine-rich protein [Proteobacteria bacterium]|nr:PxxKW family cysteine-rich protein [Pseudomonadota bacterium]